MIAYVYTLPDCEHCERAKAMARSLGYEIMVVPIDNPLVETGVQLLFRDRQVHAPVVVVPGKGAYILTLSEPMRFARIVNLEPAPPDSVEMPVTRG